MSLKKPSKAHFRLMNWIIILLIGMYIERILNRTLYVYGIDIIKLFQQKIVENTLAIKYYQFISYLATEYAIMMIVFYFYNYVDVYSSLIVLLVAGCSSIAIGILKLIYRESRPYFHEHWIQVFDCETGFGNPSGHSIVAVSLYMTLEKIFRINYGENSKKARFFKLLMIFIILNILISRLALGAHSLNQVLFGSFIGIMIYYLVFNVIMIKMNHAAEVDTLTSAKCIKTVFTVIGLFLAFGFILFNYVPISIESKEWKEAIYRNCPGRPYSKILEFDAYFLLSSCTCLVGAYLGILYDIKYHCDSDLDTWIRINLGQREANGNNNILGWNKTEKLVSIFRYFLIVCIFLLFYSLHFFVHSEAHTNIIYIVKNVIPLIASNFVLYGFTRVICVKLKTGIDVQNLFIISGKLK